MPKRTGPASDALPLDVNVTGLSDHVAVYDLYWRGEATQWQWVQLGSGTTGDNHPDHYSLAAGSAPGCQLWYSLGIGNQRKPNAPYKVLLTLGQGGARLSGGTILEEGTTNASGHAFAEDWVNVV